MLLIHADDLGDWEDLPININLTHYEAQLVKRAIESFAAKPMGNETRTSLLKIAHELAQMQGEQERDFAHTHPKSTYKA